MYTQLGVLSKGTIIECNVRYTCSSSLPVPLPISENSYQTLTHTISELGMVTAGGKVIWGRYAQVTVRLQNPRTMQASVVH